MPGHDYTEIAGRLSAAGFAPETSCAVISRATTPLQQVHQTTISHFPRAPRLAAPTLLIVGEVVRLADREVAQPEEIFSEVDNGFDSAFVHAPPSPESVSPEEPVA
jgi:siroheme synthase